MMAIVWKLSYEQDNVKHSSNDALLSWCHVVLLEVGELKQRIASVEVDLPCLIALRVVKKLFTQIAVQLIILFLQVLGFQGVVRNCSISSCDH